MFQFVQQHFGNSWGIIAFVLWAVVLAVVAFARMLLLSKAVELYSNQFGSQAQVWMIFIINGILGIGFAASAFGLWRTDNWGRLLFLWIIGLWSGSNLLAMWVVNPLILGRQYGLADLLLNGLLVTTGLIISLWYFNLPRIKTLFQTKTSKNFITEE
ncbi:MAG: hypothetical protein AB1801_18700 [Chloroflexota bacterium]